MENVLNSVKVQWASKQDFEKVILSLTKCVLITSLLFVCACLFVHLVIVRFDYEGLDPRAAFYLMRDLEAVISDKAFTSQKFAVGDHIYSVEKADNFEYIDPVDGTVARNQVSLGRTWRRIVKAGCCMTELDK